MTKIIKRTSKTGGAIFTIQLTAEQVAAISFKDKQQPYQALRPVIKSPEDIFEQLQHIGSLEQEHFAIITLSSRNHLIGKHIITTGIIDASLVHPREVFRTAILDNSTKVIIAHNHPSGDTNPSEEDILITKRIITAGKIIGISVIEHLIVGGNSWYSFKLNDLIN